VILLPIWREREPVLERYVAALLARRGLTTLVLPLPYQFGRAPPDLASGRLTVSDDLDRTRTVLVQALAEARAVRRWLRDRGLREDRIAVMGISLGGYVATLAYAADPGFARGAFVLAGGDVADLLWNDSRETRWIKDRLRRRGLDLPTVRRLCEPVEPLRLARPWRGAGAILVAAAHDPVIPPANVRSLRAALGLPPVLWLDATHVSGLVRLPEAVAWIADRLLPSTGVPLQIPPPESR
jgi:dienelactone hydrolase